MFRFSTPNSVNFHWNSWRLGSYDQVPVAQMIREEQLFGVLYSFGRAIWIVSRLQRCDIQPRRCYSCVLLHRALLSAAPTTRGWQQSMHQSAPSPALCLARTASWLAVTWIFCRRLVSRVSWTQSVFVWRLWRQQQQQYYYSSLYCPVFQCWSTVLIQLQQLEIKGKDLW